MRFISKSLIVLLGFAASCGDGGGAGGTDSAAVEAGKKTVDDRLCASCHLTDLSGSNYVYPGTQAYAPNLTPDADTGLGSWSDEQIITAILDGKDDEGRDLCSTMQRYGTLGMTEQQAQEVVAYL